MLRALIGMDDVEEPKKNIKELNTDELPTVNLLLQKRGILIAAVMRDVVTAQRLTIVEAADTFTTTVEQITGTAETMLQIIERGLQVFINFHPMTNKSKKTKYLVNTARTKDPNINTALSQRRDPTQL